MQQMNKSLAIVGISLNNGYFKDYEIRFLLQEAVGRFGRCAVMVADVPAIATYMALGYEESKARGKALSNGNSLKNRTRRQAEALGYGEDLVRIIDWAKEVEDDPRYRRHYDRLMEKYNRLPEFAQNVRQTSAEVLAGAEKPPVDRDAAIETATHYLLSELAFMEFTPELLGCKKACFLYHRNWQVYEDYIHGRYDGTLKPQLDFLLLEAPYETYRKISGAETEAAPQHDTLARVMRSGILRAAYVDYPPAFHHDEKGFSGIFYEVFAGFAKKHALKIEWVEETGYGVVIDGLAEGRFDIFGSAVWPTTERHTQASLSRPLYFSDVGLWVRKDSPLARTDWTALNDPKYRIAVTDGDITHDICLTDFTFAKWVRAPQLGRVKALLDFVADGRADATMAERMTYEAYAPGLSHPLVNIARDKPIRRYPTSFLAGKGQNDFLDVLNIYIGEVLASGTVRDIVRKYLGAEYEGIYFPA